MTGKGLRITLKKAPGYIQNVNGKAFLVIPTIYSYIYIYPYNPDLHVHIALRERERWREGKKE